MVSLLLTLLRILLPLDPVARLREVTRDYISQIMGWLDDPLDVAEIARRPDWLEILEAHIIVAENGVELLITERARQLASLPFIYTQRMTPPHLRKVKSLSRLMKRLTHLARLFHDLERLAARRAQCLKREHSESHLRLAATLQSTSPALRAVEDIMHALEVPPSPKAGEVDRRVFAPRRRGLRVPARTSATPNSRNHNPTHLSRLATENARA